MSAAYDLGRVTHTDRVLWPEDGYTKGDLIAYYHSVARWLIPYLADRPVTLERYPSGIDAGSFFELGFRVHHAEHVNVAADKFSRRREFSARRVRRSV